MAVPVRRELQPGDIFANFQIVRLLGRGGMGEVYEAIEQPLGRRVALKLIHHEKSSKRDELVERFLGEARALAKITHPNIVAMYSFGEAQGDNYMCMEYIQGRSLSQLLKSERPGLDELLRLWLEIARGIQAAHQSGLIHRDIKPSNVLITEAGHVKLIDFGVAKHMTDPQAGFQTSAGAIVGTLNYLAPEIARGKPPSFASDVYSLGAVLYEMLVGEVAFRGSSLIETLELIRKSPLKFPRRLEAMYPKELQDLVRKMMEKDPKNRPDIREVIRIGEKLHRSSWPDLMTTNAFSRTPIANREQIEQVLKYHNLAANEVRWVLNQAVASEGLVRGKGDETMSSDPKDPVYLSLASVNHALSRLNDLRKSMMSLGWSTASVPEIDKTPEREAIPPVRSTLWEVSAFPKVLRWVWGAVPTVLFLLALGLIHLRYPEQLRQMYSTVLEAWTSILTQQSDQGLPGGPSAPKDASPTPALNRIVAQVKEQALETLTKKPMDFDGRTVIMEIRVERGKLSQSLLREWQVKRAVRSGREVWIWETALGDYREYSGAQVMGPEIERLTEVGVDRERLMASAPPLWPWEDGRSLATDRVKDYGWKERVRDQRGRLRLRSSLCRMSPGTLVRFDGRDFETVQMTCQMMGSAEPPEDVRMVVAKESGIVLQRDWTGRLRGEVTRLSERLVGTERDRTQSQ